MTNKSTRRKIFSLLQWLISISIVNILVWRLPHGVVRAFQRSIRPTRNRMFPNTNKSMPLSCLSRNNKPHDNHHQFTFSTSFSSSTNDNGVAFTIDRLTGDEVYDEYVNVANMCVNVFYNKDSKDLLPPWKSIQLGSLIKAQTTDLRLRRERDSDINAMFVAYRVIAIASSKSRVAKQLELDESEIYNFGSINSVDDDDDIVYIREDGDDCIIGFCETTIKPIGLGKGDDFVDIDDSDGNEEENSFGNDKSSKNAQMIRPFLTNLAVRSVARRSGVGSKLVEACEGVARNEFDNPNQEMVLFVDGDNPKARKFYEKRGYEVVYEDPASRRYDVNGLFLRRVPCTKIAMCKKLNSASSVKNKVNNEVKKFFFGLVE